MENIMGIIALLIVVVASIILCTVIKLLKLFFEKVQRGGKPYAQLIENCILPNNQGIPIDDVAKKLEGIDISGFHLKIQETDEGGQIP